MRIEDVETYAVGNPWKTWIFVRVLTDEGITGVGEGTIGQLPRAVIGAIMDIKPLVLKCDPFAVDAIVSRLTRDIYADGGQIKMAAISAIEMACLDICGKALGVPIYTLLGGRCQERLRVYANGWYRVERSEEAFASRAAEVCSQGYTALKFDPFGTAWRTPPKADEDQAIRIIEAVRESVGPNVDLMIEAHSRFTVTAALRIAERIAPYHPSWLEEPVPHENVQATVEVARRSPVPIATGESLSSKQAIAELLAANAVDILQLEPIHLGGLSSSRRVADMVDAHYGVVAPHNAGGPIATALCCQLDAALPNFYIQEYFDAFNDPWTRNLVSHPVEVVDGYIEIADRPGLGLELDLDMVRSHPYNDSVDMNLFADQWHFRIGGREAARRK